jgi:hypothetical protein
MITAEGLKKDLADLEQQYVDHLIKRFGTWEVWAAASQRVADGKDVGEDEVPEAFRAELKMMKVILEMEALGKFDWNNPKLRQIFGEIVTEQFYIFFGEMITSIALRVARAAGVKTLLEIGAGRANLTNIMLEQMSKAGVKLPLVVTDAQPVILENVEKLKSSHPEAELTTALWNIMEPPPGLLLEKVTGPTLLYERYTLNYAALKAFENIARVADILILGDWFNCTGKLYAYDEVFKRIGSQPLFFKDVKPLLDRHFPHYLIFDQRAQEAIHLPNITMLLAWK